MDLDRLIEGLARPAAYPHPAGVVTVIQTHISVVFLAGDLAYKVRKPVDLGFLDFTTLGRRLADCRAEVALNRRLAPSVYLGVVPIVEDGEGRPVIDGPGPPVEYAVRMRRLPDDRTMASLVDRGALDAPALTRLAERIAAFHAGAERGPHVSRWGGWDVVAGNARENFAQVAAFRGETIGGDVWWRLSDLTERALAELRELIERRARDGLTCDTHGDLHLDHIYTFPDQTPPDDLVVVDGITFNPRFRFADPVADVAFLAMDLIFHGRPDLARAFTGAYFTASADGDGPTLLPFYIAYRSVVRGKVESLALGESEIPLAQRWGDGQRARAHFLLALGALAPPTERPCLALTAGLPGTGKSTLARGLADGAGFEVIRTDEIRKELAGIDVAGSQRHGKPPDPDRITIASNAGKIPTPGEVGAEGIDQGIYAPSWSDRTYAVCLERAERRLFEGRRVIVDGNFREEARRKAFADAARAWAVPIVILVCQAPADVVESRLDTRAAAGGDASDADRSVYRALAARWEAPGPSVAAAAHAIDTSGSPEAALAEALAVLRAAGLA